MKIKTLVCLMGTAFAMNAMAQHQNFGKALQRKNLPSALQACITSNAKLDAEIDALFKKEKAAGLISKAEEARYTTMEAGIKKHHDALAKDGFTLADCQAMTADYNKEKARVVEMGNDAGKMRTCALKNRALDKEVDMMFAAAKKAGKIDAAEEAEFKRMEAAIAKHRAALAKDGFTNADCDAMTKDYEAEKVKVAAMAATSAKKGGALAECRAKNAASDKEIDAMFAKAKAAGLIDKAEQAEYTRLEANIKKHRASLAKDGFTLADCEIMAKDYAAEKVAVELEQMLTSEAVMTGSAVILMVMGVGSLNGP